MKTPVLFAAGKTVDHTGDLSPIGRAEEKLNTSGAETVLLRIDPLSQGWNTPLDEGHFRSGCAPVEALSAACVLLRCGECDAVVIKGTDDIKTEYKNRQDKRRDLMNIYGGTCPLPEAYTRLAYAFIDTVNTTPEAFKKTARDLYDNYRRTAVKNNTYRRPDERWFGYITELFRGVDCANPLLDFSAGLVVGTPEAADLCRVPGKNRVGVLGVGLGETSGDGPGHINEIASFRHLSSAWNGACSQAGVDFRSLFFQGRALLEAYTCYPVVPMAFLLASGIAGSFDEISNILKNHDITITGGLNIARAPWNNPALNALVCMYECLCSSKERIGAVHGNGGLGYKQGVALIGKP